MAELDDFIPEDIDLDPNPDDEVTRLCKPQGVDSFGAETPDIGDRTPCDCDPQNIQDLEHEIAHAIRRDEGASDWFQDHDYRSWLLWVYGETKRCSDCIAEELLIRFETILDKHGIIPE